MLLVLTEITSASAEVSEVILMSTNNIGFYEEMAKIIFQLPANRHFIYSSDNTKNTKPHGHPEVLSRWLFCNNKNSI